MISVVYEEWYEYLEHSLNPGEVEFFESIHFNTAPEEHWMMV